MHNNIMAAGSKERPPMLGPGRYSQWHSRFLRYLDTKSKLGEYLRSASLKDHISLRTYQAAVEAAREHSPVAAHEEVDGDEIYSTVDACNTAKGRCDSQ
ncbi:hypothetical protein Tco_0970290 [Tanacetum coccineum]